MTDASRRDGEMDRLLRRTSSSAPDPSPTAACLDAETAAAWLAGELPESSHEVTLAHLADCARCQQLLATLTRLETEDTAAAAEEAVTPRPWWTYLVPIGVIAIMLAVVVGLPRETPRQPAAAPSKPAQAQALHDTESRFEPAPTNQKLKKEADATSAANGRNDALDRERKRADDKRDQRSQPAASADTSLPSTREPASRNVAAAPAAPPPPTTQAAAAAPKTQPLGSLTAARANEAQDTKALSQTVVVSPDRNIQWRLSGAAVEKSTDAGASWTATPIEPPAVWTAGSAPSSSVCWLVGRGGAVARTVDGRTWQRLTFPAQTDLSSIQASDAQIATVLTADGRTFATTDGGNTWIPRVLQERPAAPFRD